MCKYLCIEQQVLSYCKVIKQYIMLGTKSQAASDQSHVLTDVVTTDISPAAGGRKQTWNMKEGSLIFYLGGIFNVCVYLLFVYMCI